MRLCTKCISCMELTLLPKRARFLSEPPPNRPQISERSAALLSATSVNGLKENKGKRTSQKHPNSFPSRAKGLVGFSHVLISVAPTAFFEVLADLRWDRTRNARRTA